MSRRVERLVARGNVPGLCRLLHHRDALVRRRAAQALGELGQSGAVPHLVRALQEDSDQYVVRWAIEALARIGDQMALDALFAASFGTDRSVSELAIHALRVTGTPQAADLLSLRDGLIRSDWESLSTIGETGQRGLQLVMRSPQYTGWPSGKRKRVLELAGRLGITTPRHLTGDLTDMGLFLSGVHTVGDLITGLRHRSPAVRIAAAEKLGASGQAWTTLPLSRRFRREMHSDGEREVAIAIARALSQLGDERATDFYRKRLYGTESPRAADAARCLSAIRTQAAIDALFWFVVEPPPAPRYRNVPVVMSALSSAGPVIIDHLKGYCEHDEARVRRIMITLLARPDHPEAPALLGRLARDDDPTVQREALDALGSLNSAAAAAELRGLLDDVPREPAIRALIAITQPEALAALRQIVPDATMITGILLEDDGQPIQAAHVQVIREHYFGEGTGWGWQAVSARACTDAAGAFHLTLWEPPGSVRLKVAMPVRVDGTGGETFMAGLPLTKGTMNRVQARIERFLARLVVTVELEQSSER